MRYLFGGLRNIFAFCVGWDDYWGIPHQTVVSKLITDTMSYMYGLNASFNFYMFAGGTNFAYMNSYLIAWREPITTTYDYDAPLSEAGDPTAKYYAIREAIHELLNSLK